MAKNDAILCTLCYVWVHHKLYWNEKLFNILSGTKLAMTLTVWLKCRSCHTRHDNQPLTVIIHISTYNIGLLCFARTYYTRTRTDIQIIKYKKKTTQKWTFTSHFNFVKHIIIIINMDFIIAIFVITFTILFFQQSIFFLFEVIFAFEAFWRDNKKNIVDFSLRPVVAFENLQNAQPGKYHSKSFTTCIVWKNLWILPESFSELFCHNNSALFHFNINV